MTMLDLVDRMSTSPAKIIGSDRGTLNIGAPADIVIFDENEEFIVDVNEFETKGKNSPYGGMKLFGKVHRTILGGKTVYRCN